MSLIDKFINTGNNQNTSTQSQPEKQSALDAALNTSPDYQPINLNTGVQTFEGLFQPSEQSYDFSPELVETKFNNDLQDWVNSFKNSWDETQKSPYQYKINYNQDIIDKNIDAKNTLDYLFEHKGIQEDEYNQRLKDLEEANNKAKSNIQSAQEGVDTNQKEIEENYVSKKYKLMEELVNSKGSDAGFLEAMQYTFPSGLGSMVSMYGTQIAATLGSGTIKNLATAAVTGAVEGLAGGPAAGITVPLSMAVATFAQIAPIIYARNSESLAELGDASESAKSELLNNWYIENGNPQRDPNGPQPSDEDLRQIRMSSMKGMDELYKQNMLLSIPDAALTILGSAFIPKGFSILSPATKFANYNKYTRFGAAVGLGYVDSVSERIEEGYQYAAQQRQRSKALDLDNYSDKGFMMNSLSDYYDTVESINFGLPYGDLKMGGRYSDNPEFQSAAESGGLLGIIGGGVKTGAKIFNDVNTYLNVNKDLKEKGVIDSDSKVFSLKNQIYAKYFDENNIDFLLEGVRNLATTKDENGTPLMTKEDSEQEVKNITTAFNKYQTIEKYLNNIEPDGFLNLKRTPQQQQMLKAAKISLLNNSMDLTRYEKNLPQKGSVEIENNINNLIEQQSNIVESIEKEIKDNPANSTIFSLKQRLNTASKNLENLVNTKAAFIQSLELTPEEFDNRFPSNSVSLDLNNENKNYLINSINYEVAKQEYADLKTIKDKKTLENWFNNYMANVQEKQEATEIVNDANKRTDENEINSEDILTSLTNPDINEVKNTVKKINDFKFDTKSEEVKGLVNEQNKNKPNIDDTQDLYKIKNSTDNAIVYWENVNKQNKRLEASVNSSIDKEELGNYIKSIESHIKNLKASSAEFEQRIKASNNNVINSIADILDVFSLYLPEKTQKLISTINAGVLLNNAFIKIEEYAGSNNTVPDSKNNKVLIKPSRINGKAVKLYLSNEIGDDIELGGILDPSRFIVNGKEFNPNNLSQLVELNENYVKDNKITAEGENFVKKWFAAKQVWEDIEKNNGLNNKQLQERVYINSKNLIIYTIKQKGIDINDLPNLTDIVTADNYIKFSTKVGSKTVPFEGIPIVKYQKGKVIKSIWLLKFRDDGTPFIEEVNESNKIITIKDVIKNADDTLSGSYKAYINNPQDNKKPKTLILNFPKLDFEESISDALLRNKKSMEDRVSKVGDGNIDSEVIKDSKGRDIIFSTDIGNGSYSVTLNIRGINEKSKRSTKDKKPGTIYLNISNSNFKGDDKIFFDNYVKIYFDENDRLVHEHSNGTIVPIDSNEDLVLTLNNVLSYLDKKGKLSITPVPYLRNIKVDLETPDEQSLLNIKSNAGIKTDPRIDITPKSINQPSTPPKPSGKTSAPTTSTTPVNTTDKQELDRLRAEEQAEYAAMPNPNDAAARKKIYDDYDKSITPVLNRIKADIKARREEEYKGNIVEEVKAYKITVKGKEYEIYEQKYDKNSNEYFLFVKRPNGEITSVSREEEKIITTEGTNKQFLRDETSEWIDLEEKAEIDAKYDAELDELKVKPSTTTSTATVTTDVITDQDYNNFVNNNVVSDVILNSIADKVINKVSLSQKEIAIFSGKTSEINDIIRKKASVSTDVKPENISSKGSEFAKKLTNVGNTVRLTYKGKQYVNSEHAYQTWKSGEFNQAGYDLKGGKVKGGKIGDTFSIMTDILTEKLKQHPELVQGIDERGGLAYIEQSTHNVIGDKFWESTGQNKFIEALAQAYKNIKSNNVSTDAKASIDSDIQNVLNAKNKEELIKAAEKLVGMNPYDQGAVSMGTRAALMTPGSFDRGKALFLEEIKSIIEIKRKSEGVKPTQVQPTTTITDVENKLNQQVNEINQKIQKLKSQIDVETNGVKKLQLFKQLGEYNKELLNLQNTDTNKENVPFKVGPSTNIKPGVEEVFDSNPELANQVYQALGFEIPTTKLQGKQFEYGEPRFFDVVEELTSGERASLPSSILINKLLKGEYLPEIKESQIILGLSEAGIWRPNIKKIEASGENKSTLAKKIGHELLHSVTNNIILSYQNLKGTVDFTDKYYKDFIKQGYIKPVDLSKSQIEALDNLVRIRNKVISYVEQNKDKIQKQDRGFGTYDYFIRTNYTESETDLHEFISEVFTNPELINILKEIPTEGKKSNLFKDFVDAIAKILGFTNTSILEDIIAYSEEAFFTQPQITQQQKQQALQLYSQYLDSIFPNSQVKDILYHGAMEHLLPKDGKFKGYVTYFTDFKKYAEKVGLPINRKIVSAIVNIKKPFNSKSELADVPLEVHVTDKFTNPRIIKSNASGYDSVIGIDAGQKEGKTIAVFEPEQIHILGNKQDIEGFKKFVNKNKNVSPKSEKLSEEELVDTNYEKIRENLSKILPDYISITDLNVITKNLNLNKNTWGAFYQNVIYLANKMGKGTEYHEAFHAIFRTVVSPIQRRAFYLEAAKKYKQPSLEELNELKNLNVRNYNLTQEELTNLWYEEKAADDFQKYMLKEQAKPKGVFSVIFNKIKSWINFFRGRQDYLDTLFSDIAQGKYKKNEFYSFNLSNPVFKLLKINNEKGYLSATQSQRIINTVFQKTKDAINDIRKENLQEKGKFSINTSKDDIKLAIYDWIYYYGNSYYTVDNFQNELLALSDINTDKAITISEKISDISFAINLNTDLIFNDVFEKINLYLKNINENANPEIENSEDVKDDTINEYNFDHTPMFNEYFPNGMKNYLDNITVGVDEFGFGNLIDLKDEKFNMASNTKQLHDMLTRSLVNTSKNKMFSKLALLSQTNETLNSFWQKLKQDISKELNVEFNENTDFNIIIKSNLANLFLSSYKKNLQSEVMSLYDPKSKLFKVFRADVNDESKIQFEQWKQEFDRLDRSNETYSDSNLSVLNNVSELMVYTDQSIDYDLFLEKSDDYISLNERIDSIKSELQQIGINLSTGYIRYSLLKNQEEFIDSKIQEVQDDISNLDTKNTNAIESKEKELEYYNEFKNELDLFVESEPLSFDDIKGLESSFVSNNNPFVYSGIDEDEFENTGDETQKDTGSVGRLIKIAFNNALFDETVGSTTYQNAEGKTIYNKILPYYITEELNRLKSNKTFRQFIALVNQDDFDFEEANSLIESSFKEDNLFVEPSLIKYFTNALINNPYIKGINNIGVDNVEFALFIFNQIKTNIAGGIRSEKLKETEDNEVFSAGFGKSEGLSFGSLDAKAKLLDSILKFTESSKNSSFKERNIAGKKVKITDYNTNVIEAKNTQIITKLPVYSFYKNDEITDLALDFLYNLFLSEYNRIGIAKNDDEIIITNFNDPDSTKQKGLDFFRFKRLAALNPELYNKLIESAKSRQNLETAEDGELKKQLIEGLKLMAEEQFNLYLDRLSEKSINIIKGDRANGYENNSLPSEYVVDDKVNVNALGEYFFNDWLNSMSINSIIHGDFALNYKDFVDVVKRNARFIAAGPSLGSTTTKILILKDRGANETSKLKNIIGNKTATDGQSQATLKWFIEKYALSLGKLKPNSNLKELLLKIEKGYILKNIEDIKALEEAGLLTNPKKIVVAGRNEYDKTSAKIILRSTVSYLANKSDRKKADDIYDEIFRLREENASDNDAKIKQLYSELHNLWIPIPSEKELHDRLNQMELNNYDLASYETALKTIIPLKIKGRNILSLEVSDTFIKEQVITDAHKKEVIDGTQKLNLIWSEQDDNTDVHILGKKVSIGQVKKNYLKLLSLRMNEGYKNMMNVLTNKDLSSKDRVTSYKFLLKKLQESNEISGSDPYIMELYKLAEDLDKPAYNLNLPQILKKFENNYLAIVSKNTIKWKVPGLKGTLVSDANSGVNYIGNNKNNIIPLLNFENYVRTNPTEKVKTRSLLYREYDPKTKQYYTEIKMSAQLAAQLNIKIGDELDENLIKAFGIRIPTQDKHSMGSFRVVDFLPMESGNEVMVPVEILALSGADFDIDSLFLRFLSTFNKKIESLDGEVKYKRVSFGDYLSSDLQTKSVDDVMRNAFDEFKFSNLKYNLKLKNTLQELNESFELEDYNIEAVGLENVKKEQLKDLQAVKDAILQKALSISELPSTLEEFKSKYQNQILNNIKKFNDGNLESIKPITLDEINNLLFESEYVLQYNEGNEEISNTPSSTDVFKDLAKLLDEKYDIELYKELIGAESPYDKSIAAENNDVGKSNIGPAAIYNIVYQRLANFKIQGRNKINNSFDTFISNGKRINDLISSTLSAMTDNAKDPWASKFNLTLEAMGSALQGIGTNQGFNETLLLHKQDAIKNLLDAFTSKKSPVNEDNIKYIPNSFIIEKEKENYPHDQNDEIEYNFDNLAKAIKYSQDLKNGIENNELTQRQYNYIQYASIAKFEILNEESKFILNLNSILQLLKGFPATWNEFEIIEESFVNLGIRPVLKSGKNPEDPNSYSFEHTPAFINDSEGDLFPYDFLPIFKNDDVVRTLSQIYFAQKSFAKRYFISQSPTAIEMKNFVKDSFKESTFKYEDNLDSLRTGLITFLSMKAYRHFSKSNINIQRLFNKDLWDSFNEAKRISPNNGFLKSLSKTKTLIKKGIFKDKILYKLSINTRTQSSPDFVISLMDEFKSLYNNLQTREFAIKAFENLLIKDNLLFKNGSYIRNIEPALLGNISKQMDSVQDLFSLDKISDADVRNIFGVSKKELIKEFTTIYSLTSENSFNLLSSKSKDFFGEIKKIIPELNPKEGEDSLTEEEIKDLSPIEMRNNELDETKKVIYVDIISRTVKGDKKNNAKQINLNKKALASTGIFSFEKDGVGLPKFFYISTPNKEGVNIKRYFELKEALDINGDIDIWNTSKVIASKGYYEEVDLFGTKEIGSMYWTVDEHRSMKETLDNLYKNLSTASTTLSTKSEKVETQEFEEVELPDIDTESNVDKVLRESATPELTDKYLDDNFPPQKLDKLGSYIASYRLKYDSIKDEKGVVTKSAIQNNKLKDLSKSLLSNYSKFKTELTSSSNPRELWRKFLRDNINDVLLLSGISINQFEKYYNDTLSLEELNNC